MDDGRFKGRHTVDWQMFLFSTAGRINRAKYWLAALVYVVLSVVACIVAVLLLTSTSDAAAVILYVGGGVVFLGLYFSAIAVAIKRLHDRDKTGWWSVPFLVLPGMLQSASSGLVSPATGTGLSIAAAILGIWGLVELGCLRGTIGPNSFSDDPLATPATQPVAP
jgi:uncharacterized membrane protein YhaH (DUF805 family)